LLTRPYLTHKLFPYTTLFRSNHDDRIAFRKALEGQTPPERPIADRNVAIVRTARANFFLLDSLDVVDRPPGKLGEAQIGWLARRSEEHTSELQSLRHLVCRLL